MNDLVKTTANESNGRKETGINNIQNHPSMNISPGSPDNINNREDKSNDMVTDDPSDKEKNQTQ